jgi:glycopeptide antibiotics resistance protein
LNLIPLMTLNAEDIKTSLLNILMMIPFGFGLPFITDFRMKKVVITGFLFSVLIEFLQFATGYIANTTFRVADVNDLIFNTLGTAIGYMIFVGFIRIFRNVFRHGMPTNSILRYITERPQLEKK